MKRSDGERERLQHSIGRLRDTLDGLERGMLLGGPVGQEAAQAVMQTAMEIATQIARLDAFELVEDEDLRERISVRLGRHTRET